MSRLPRSALPPEDYHHESSAAGEWAVDRAHQALLADTGFGPNSDGALGESAVRGRGAMGYLELGDGSALFVRRYRHGGLLRWLTGERFRHPVRPFAELRLACELEARGVRTPRVVAARARRGLGGWRLDLVTRAVDDVQDLGFELAAAQRGELAHARRCALVRAFGALVGRLHALGFVHADLQPNNFLAPRTGPLDADALWTLDLDGSHFAPAPLSDAVRHRNLARLLRHVDRREGARGARLPRTDRARFLSAYEAAAFELPERGRRRADARAIAARQQQRARWSGLSWRLERGRRLADDPRGAGAARS